MIYALLQLHHIVDDVTSLQMMAAKLWISSPGVGYANCSMCPIGRSSRMRWPSVGSASAAREQFFRQKLRSSGGANAAIRSCRGSGGAAARSRSFEGLLAPELAGRSFERKRESWESAPRRYFMRRGRWSWQGPPHAMRWFSAQCCRGACRVCMVWTVLPGCSSIRCHFESR